MERRLAAIAELAARIKVAEDEVATMKRDLAADEEFVVGALEALGQTNARLKHPLGETLIYQQSVRGASLKREDVEAAQAKVDAALGELAPRLTRLAVDAKAVADAAAMLLDAGREIPEEISVYAKTAVRYRHNG